MPLIEWEDRMNIGVRELDAEHERLALLINQLFDAMQEGAGRAKLKEILESLIDYTNTHFEHEEYLLEKTGYPNIEAHKKEHLNLRRQIIGMKEKYKSKQSDVITIEILTFLKNWLINHTTGSDKKLGPYLNAHGIN
jgi:hemerythrin